MKTLKFLGCILGLLFFQPSIAQDLIKIDQDINEIHQKSIYHHDELGILLQNRAQLEFYNNLSLKCISKQKAILAKLEKYQKVLKPSGQIPYVLQEKNRIIQNINNHQDKLQLCEYMQFKVSNHLNEIAFLNKKIYLKSLLQSDDNIFENLRKIRLLKWEPVSFNILQSLLLKTNSMHNVRNTFIIFLCLMILKLLRSYQLSNTQSRYEFDTSRFILVALIFFALGPPSYLMIKTQMMHFEEVLVTVFSRPLTNLIGILFVLYTYYDIRSISKKEIFLAFITIMLKFLLVRYSLGLTYLMIQQHAVEQILAYKYILFVFLTIQVFLILYWSVFKIMKLNMLRSHAMKAFMIFESIIIILGLFGYVNLAININSWLIVFFVLMLWLFVLTKLKNIFFSSLENKNNLFLNKFYNAFGFDLREAGLNLKIVVNYVYFISFFVILLTIFSLSFLSTWIMPADFIENLYNFIFKTNSFHQFNFRIINYLYAIFAFFLLNSINKILSTIIARKLFKDPISIQKTSEFFYILGLFVVLMISLLIADFQFENFTLILGGLSFGVGLGLKNILSGLISSIFLFVNRPFEVGDFVAIGETKGYVKKISVMETIIETTDENVLILPNQLVANTVIYNFNYGKKGTQRIHLKYSLEHLSEDNEKQINTLVMDILESQGSSIDKKDPPKIIFSPLEQSLEGYSFEVIFGVSSTKKTPEMTNLVNRLILDKLQVLNLNIKYESSTHPMQ